MGAHKVIGAVILSVCVLYTQLLPRNGYSQDSSLQYHETLRLWIVDDQPQAWAPTRGMPLLLLPQPSDQGLDPALSFSWRADGNRLAVGYQDAVRIWDLTTGDVVRAIPFSEPIPETLPGEMPPFVHVAWSPDGRLLAITRLGKLQILNADTGVILHDCGEVDTSANLAWSPDSRQVVGKEAYDGTSWSSILVCEMGQETAHLIDPAYGSTVFAYSPDGTKLATISDSFDYQPYIRIYDTVTRQLDVTLQGRYALAWSPDGTQLVTTTGGLIQIRDTKTYLPIVNIPSGTGVLAWHPQANRLLAKHAGGDRDDLAVYDTVSGAVLTVIDDSWLEWIRNTGAGVPDGVKWSPEGTRFALVGAGMIRIYTESGSTPKITPTPMLQQTITPQSTAGATPTPVQTTPSTANPRQLRALVRSQREYPSYRWSADGSLGVEIVASGVQAGVWHLYRLGDPTSELLIRLTDPKHFALSPDGRRFAVASYHDDARGKPDAIAPRDARRLRVWAIDAMRNIVDIPDNDTVTAIAWSPDGKWIAVTDQTGQFSLWDANSQTRVFSAGKPYFSSGLTWSPDSRWLAVMRDDTLLIYSLETVSPYVSKPWILQNYTGGAVFSPDNLKIAVATDTGLVRIWDLCTHQLIDTIKGHQSRVSMPLWAPDSQTIATFSNDYALSIPAKVIVQDTLTHRVVANINGVTPLNFKMGWDNSGTRLIMAEMDGGRVQMFDTQTGELHELVKGAGLLTSALSTDGQWLAVAFRNDNPEDSAISILDTHTGQVVIRLPSAANVYFLEWSPDAKHLLSLDIEDNATLWGEE